MGDGNCQVFSRLPFHWKAGAKPPAHTGRIADELPNGILRSVDFDLPRIVQLSICILPLTHGTGLRYRVLRPEKVRQQIIL
jgi:hypothetical protein